MGRYGTSRSRVRRKLPVSPVRSSYVYVSNHRLVLAIVAPVRIIGYPAPWRECEEYLGALIPSTGRYAQFPRISDPPVDTDNRRDARNPEILGESVLLCGPTKPIRWLVKQHALGTRPERISTANTEGLRSPTKTPYQYCNPRRIELQLEQYRPLPGGNPPTTGHWTYS